MSELPFEMRVSPEAFPTSEGLGQILKVVSRQYARQGWNLTRPLLAPLLKITLGMYACLVLSYLWADAATQGGLSPWIAGNLWLMLTGLALIVGLSAWPFLTGFWEYMVYFASLNRNAVEAFEERPIQAKPAYETVLRQNGGAYQWLLLGYLGLPLLVFVAFAMLSWLAMALSITQDEAGATTVLMAFALQAFGALACMLLAFLFTYVFQIVAFEAVPVNPIPTLLKSAQLVGKRWPAALGLHVLLAVTTTLVAPMLVSTLFRVLNIAPLLELLHGWLIQLILKDAPVGSLPGSEQVFQMLSNNMDAISSGLTDSLLGFWVTSLLLPVGTLAFTRLYWNIRSNQ